MTEAGASGAQAVAKKIANGSAGVRFPMSGGPIRAGSGVCPSAGEVEVKPWRWLVFQAILEVVLVRTETTSAFTICSSFYQRPLSMTFRKVF